MPATSLLELYQQKLVLILDAERQALEAYPQMAALVSNDRLRQAVETHRRETQQQVEQLQQLLALGAVTVLTTRCVSMQALIVEAQETARQIEDADARDAFLLGAAQAMEHHEIAAYGTARAWARQLGRAEDVPVLERILDQEKRTDALLTQLAEAQVNEDAAQGAAR